MASVVTPRRSPRLARRAELATDSIIRQYKGQLAVLLDILNDLESDFSNSASLAPEEWRLVNEDLEEVAGLTMGLLILGSIDGFPEIRRLDGGIFGRYSEATYQMMDLVKLVRRGDKKAATTLRRINNTILNGVRAIAWKAVKAW